MSEEEIIENINEMIELIDNECYISIAEDIESIRGLLYLYNEEKRKNEKIKKGILDIYLNCFNDIDYFKGDIIRDLDKLLEEINGKFRHNI